MPPALVADCWEQASWHGAVVSWVVLLALAEVPLRVSAAPLPPVEANSQSKQLRVVRGECPRLAEPKSVVAVSYPFGRSPVVVLL